MIAQVWALIVALVPGLMRCEHPRWQMVRPGRLVLKDTMDSTFQRNIRRTIKFMVRVPRLIVVSTIPVLHLWYSRGGEGFGAKG